MVPKSSYPPTHHHPSLTTSLSPSTAATHLSHYLAQSQTKPHLHPDSLLSSTGITYSAHSGPNGGLALHHLRRIEAGLRGENLVKESAEELARFEEGVDDALPEGDDSRLDTLINHTATSKDDRASAKRKRKAEQIEQWAAESSHAGSPPRQQEIESFANTPLHVPHIDDGWQDQVDYELEQQPLEGELGEREGAPVVKQNGKVPKVVKHDDSGRKKDEGKTEGEKKRAKREAKKARRLKERQEKGASG